MASGYDVTIKLYQNHVIEGLNAIIAPMYFVAVILLFQLSAKHRILEFLCDLEFVYKYFAIQNIEILGLKNVALALLKKHNK